jgi:LysM repeat protein
MESVGQINVLKGGYAMKHTKKLAASTLALAVVIGGGIWSGQFANAATATKQLTQNVKELGGHFGKKGGGFKEITNSAEIATLLGLTADELTTQLKAGKTLAAIAAEKGVAVQKLTDLISKTMTAKLDKELADGKITQTEYDKRKADLADRATKIVNGELGPKQGGRGHGGGFMADNAEIATLLGVTADELKTQLEAGKTLAAIAGEKGVAVQKLTDLISKTMTAKLDKELADGKITQTEYDKRKADLADRATKIVNGELGPKQGGRGKHGHDDDEESADSATDTANSETSA